MIKGLRNQYIQVFLLFLIGILLWHIPVPQGVSPKAWHLFAIFLTTIFAIIVNPLPISVIAIFSILACVITRTLTIEKTLNGFGTSTVWLIVFAFFISRGFIKTGLGKRIAYFFVSKIGKKTLGLSYGLVLTETILAPMIPSVTARSGGIIFPIAKSLAEEYGKVSNQYGKSNKTGAFLMQVCFQSNIITSAMFYTAMAGNSIIASLAKDLGVTLSWGDWAKGAIVPGLISLIIIPLILYCICPPTIKVFEEAPKQAKQALQEMGRISVKEIIMLFTFVLLLVLWIFGKAWMIDETTTALIGFSILLLTKVLDWNDALSERGAWDTFIWFATLIMMSSQLKDLGMMEWVGLKMESLIDRNNLLLSLAIVIVLYFYVHYIFAGVTGKITVLYAAFLVLLINAGLSPMACALILAYFSSLGGGLTHFGIGSAPVFFESNYLSTQQWWKIGAIIGVVNLIIWGGIGSLWLYFLGWW